jgi:hypothetical protein
MTISKPNAKRGAVEINVVTPRWSRRGGSPRAVDTDTRRQISRASPVRMLQFEACRHRGDRLPGVLESGRATRAYSRCHSLRHIPRLSDVAGGAILTVEYTTCVAVYPTSSASRAAVVADTWAPSRARARVRTSTAVSGWVALGESSRCGSPSAVADSRFGANGGQGVGQHLMQTGAAEHLNGLCAPDVALLCQRARLMFGFARFQGGLLGQGDDLDVGRLASVVGLKLLGQLGRARFDRRAPARPPRHQLR